MHKPRPLLHYFSRGLNREVTELYSSTAIADMAMAMILVFEPIFFVAVLGWSVAQVLLFFAGVYGLYMLFIPLGAKIAARRGYKHAILYSIPFQILYWLALFNSANFDFAIYLAIFFFAVQKSLYWPAFHADLASFSSKKQRSRESSGILAISHIVYILGPLVGGLISHSFGVRVLFVIASAVYFTMFIPLFTTPDGIKERYYSFKKTLALYKKFPREAAAFLGHGEELLVLAVWPIFIYAVVPNFFSLGSLIALTTFVSTILLLAVGKFSDQGKRLQFLTGGVTVSVLTWIGRIFSNTLLGVFAADALSRMSRDTFLVPLISKIYDRGNEEKDTLAYTVFFEQALSMGKFLACIIGAGVFALTQSFAALFILAGTFTLLYLFMPMTKRSLFRI